MQAKMVPAQYNKFINTLISKYGRYSYFKMRKGEMPIDADNQVFTKNLLTKIGAPDYCDFEAYEDKLVW